MMGMSSTTKTYGSYWKREEGARKVGVGKLCQAVLQEWRSEVKGHIVQKSICSQFSKGNLHWTYIEASQG